MNEQQTNPETQTTTSTTSSNSERRAQSARRKFTNLANGRMRRALLALDVLGNLGKLTASKDQMSEADVGLMMATVQAAVARCGRKLASGATGQQLDVEFDLDRPAS